MTKNETFEQYFLFLLVLVLFVLMMMPFARGVSLGFLIAVVFGPLYEKLRSKLGKRDHLSALITTLLLTVCVVLPVSLIVVGVIKEAAALVQSLRTSAADFDIENSMQFLQRYRNIYRFVPFSEGELKTKLQEVLGTMGTGLAGLLGSFVSSLPVIAMDIAFFLLSFYYALIDGERLSQFVQKVLPFSRSDVLDLISTTQKICQGVVIGSLISGVVQGIVMGVAFAIFGVPGALLFGALTVVFSFVPVLGVGPTGIGGIIYLLIHGQKGAALGMLIAMGIGSISDNIVKPLALKGSVELHPLLGLLAALGGLVIFGFVGLFIGPLIAALLIVLLEMLGRAHDRSQSAIN